MSHKGFPPFKTPSNAITNSFGNACEQIVNIECRCWIRKVFALLSVKFTLPLSLNSVMICVNSTSARFSFSLSCLIALVLHEITFIGSFSCIFLHNSIFTHNLMANTVREANDNSCRRNFAVTKILHKMEWNENRMRRRKPSQFYLLC